MPRTKNNVGLRHEAIGLHTAGFCNSAHSTEVFLAYKNVQVLEDWPSNSPDLNLVENLWGYMEHKLKNRVCTTNDDLWHQILGIIIIISLGEYFHVFNQNFV